MRFLNSTAAPALAFEYQDGLGEQFHVVVARQRFQMTSAGLTVLAKQGGLVEEDVCFGAMHVSSTRQESDLSPYKPRCDVIVNATAYAPKGQPCTQFNVRLALLEPASGNAQKALIDKPLRVSGERSLRLCWLGARWLGGLLNWATLGWVKMSPWRLTAPGKIESLPVRYEYAYGGQWRVDVNEEQRLAMARRIGKENCLTAEQLAEHPDAKTVSATVPLAHIVCEQNPIGRGFATAWYLKVLRAPVFSAPQIECIDQLMDGPRFWLVATGKAEVLPGGFGAIGRAWLPRRSCIGKVESRMDWAPDDIPSLPDDFDYGYWNSAPRDQQCPHLQGNEEVVLINLCKPDHPLAQAGTQGQTILRFALPGVRAYLALNDTSGRYGAKLMLLDTVEISPDSGTVDLVWRATISTMAQLDTAELRFATCEQEIERLNAMLSWQKLASQFCMDRAEGDAHAA